MKTKRIVGTTLLFIGVAFIIFSFYIKHRVDSAKESIEGISGILPKSSYSDSLSEGAQSAVSRYDSTVVGLLVGGIVFVLIGGAIVLRKKKS